jgi:hypothetical protein
MDREIEKKLEGVEGSQNLENEDLFESASKVERITDWEDLESWSK